MRRARCVGARITDGRGKDGIASVVTLGDVRVARRQGDRSGGVGRLGAPLLRRQVVVDHMPEEGASDGLDPQIGESAG